MISLDFVRSPEMAAMLSLFVFSFLVLAGESVDPIGDDVSVSRESFPLDGDVAWVVQISDLHLSAYHPERGHDLVELLAPALRVIRPSLLLITGDITDAKNKRRSSTRQDESEWIQYRNRMDAMVRHSGFERRRTFDIRGNHDKYGVPYVGDRLDFFSIYSVSSQLNRHSTVYSISLVGDYRKYQFLGIDDTIPVGIRGPSNLFGHPTDRRIDAVESELQYWSSEPNASVTKVVFGHFPMSFTASSEKGKNYRSVFARESVSAYICGHLHAKFSKKLWRLHKNGFHSVAKAPVGINTFWEWELGDWKESRLMRILAIDEGKISFMDIELASNNHVEENFQTTILITYPTDSRCMNLAEVNTPAVRNDINALVFSSQPILNVSAKVFDSARAFKVVEEIPLQLVRGSANDKPFYHAKWNAENYKSAFASQFWLQVFVLDAEGNETASVSRPFSVEGKLAYHSMTWLARLIFYIQWEDLYSYLLWSNICFLILLLSLSKLLNYFMERNESYQRWATSSSASSTFQHKEVLFRIFWFLIEGSRSTKFWFAMVVYLLYLLKMPWFFGRATSENGDIARMYIHGWTIRTPFSQLMEEKQASPDVMAITIPFMYLVASPMILLIYGLFAKTSASRLHYSRKIRCCNEPLSRGQEHECHAGAPPSIGNIRSISLEMCGDWRRRALVLAFLILTFIHFKLCSALMAAYGAGPVALSPALSWVPPLLLGATVYATVIKEDKSLRSEL